MRLLHRRDFYFFILACGFFPSLVLSASTEPWPETLTLEFALGQASVDHPQLQMATASIDKAKAKKLLVETNTSIESTISARLRWIDPPDIAFDQSQDDHRLSLFVKKRLYDFGYTKTLEEAADAGIVGRENYYQYALNQHRLTIMAAYFDVLLADFANGRNEEDVKITFLYADRAENRNELGMVSDIDVLEAQSNYQASRLRLHRSRALQRTTRANLANALNRPENLPSEINVPDLLSNNRDIPESVDAWQALSEKQNPLLLALQAKMISKQKQLASARDIANPVLTSEIEVSAYTRESGGYDNWRAGVTLDVPLPTSGKTKAAVADKRASFLKVKAELEHQRRQIHQAVLESWSDLQTLKIESDRVEAAMDFRDLYLDRSRALYQLEVKTDFGDAMIRSHEAHLDQMKNKFTIALTWARLEALLGRTVYSGENLTLHAGQEAAP